MNSKLDTWQIIVVCFALAALFVFFTSGCSTSNRRQQLQEEHPDCFVFEDLNIECPNPFESSAGFGMGIQNEKPKKKKK